MSAEAMGEWLQRQGHRVVRTASSGWYDASPHVYQAFPFHWVISPSDEELEELLRRNRALALRYSTPLNAAEGRLSYHMVRTNPYGLESLERRVRQGVRHGLERCRVEPIAFERLARDGWALEEDTCRRQGRRIATSPQAWRRRCLAAVGLPGFVAWGALVDGCLAASVFGVRVGDCLELISQQCLSRYLDAHVNNALAFTATREALASEGVASVFYSLESLDAPASVDVFKLRMGFTAAPLRQRVVLHPWVSPQVESSLERLAHAAATRFPDRSFLTKADGMLRFHRQGRLPLSEQPWPECLPVPDALAARRAVRAGAARAAPVVSAP